MSLWSFLSFARDKKRLSIDGNGLKAYTTSFILRLYMKDLAENNVIRFINITRKKEGIFANFKVKGIKGGVVFSASISVDITAAEVDPGDALEKIIEECARHGCQRIKAF